MLYYTPPSQEIFDEVKAASLHLWTLIDTDNNRYGYTTEKHARITPLRNVSDNLMYMISMFDRNNQTKLAHLLTPAARQAIRERLLDGGHNPSLIPF